MMVPLVTGAGKFSYKNAGNERRVAGRTGKKINKNSFKIRIIVFAAIVYCFLLLSGRNSVDFTHRIFFKLFFFKGL
jgi:hypothetical protein